MNDVIIKATGTAGENPIVDSGIRGAIIVIVNGCAALIVPELDLDATQQGTVHTVLSALIVVAFGIWDRLVKGTATGG